MKPSHIFLLLSVAITCFLVPKSNAFSVAKREVQSQQNLQSSLFKRSSSERKLKALGKAADKRVAKKELEGQKKALAQQKGHGSLTKKKREVQSLFIEKVSMIKRSGETSESSESMRKLKAASDAADKHRREKELEAQRKAEREEAKHSSRQWLAKASAAADRYNKEKGRDSSSSKKRDLPNPFLEKVSMIKRSEDANKQAAKEAAERRKAAYEAEKKKAQDEALRKAAAKRAARSGAGASAERQNQQEGHDSSRKREIEDAFFEKGLLIKRSEDENDENKHLKQLKAGSNEASRRRAEFEAEKKAEEERQKKAAQSGQASGHQGSGSKAFERYRKGGKY